MKNSQTSISKSSGGEIHSTDGTESRPLPGTLMRFGFALLTVSVALAVTVGFDLRGLETPFTMFYAAVVATSWYGGRNAGIIAIILSVAAASFFVLPPYAVPPGVETFLQLAVFSFVSFVIAWLSGAHAHSQRSLDQTEKRYRLLFDKNPMPMWVFDKETLEFLEVNEAAVRHYGYSREEFLSMTIKDIRPKEDVPVLMQEVAQLPNSFGVTRTWRHMKKNGDIIEMEISAHAIEFAGRRARLVLATDVTERRTLEDQLRQSQKMEAIGMLAGGVAHDFNNLLTVISGYTELAQRLVEDGHKAKPKLEEIAKASERAAALTGQLLAFSRKQVLQPAVININEVVANMEKMLRRLIGEDVEFRTVLDADLGSTKADPGQIEQVLVNLVVNARDAMPKGGKLTIETSNAELNEEYARMHIAVVPGPYVMIGVSDTGVGMDEATIQRIFEPFFSTKETGKGTGLGLSTTYGIVKQSGGNIWVYSEPGKGTTLKIYLPRVDAEARSIRSRDEKAPVLRGRETILLAEDEESVRSFACEVLEGYGYRVIPVESGADAIRSSQMDGTSIDLVITDVIMPEMSGPELAKALSKTHPGLKVIYMSGYTDSAIVHRGELEDGANFVQKPFHAEALGRKVREVLDNKSGT